PRGPPRRPWAPRVARAPGAGGRGAPEPRRGRMGSVAAVLPSVPARSGVIDRLEGEVFDRVVVGGGITGAGGARGAAKRGLTVALLEGHDFASGTSSRSSKLIHGGLRYLPMGDLPLVRRTAQERKVIHRLAPHLCEPRWMVYPVETRRALAAMKVGVTTYE